MADTAFVLIEILRFLSPVIIFINPYAAIMISFILDIYDSQLAFWSKMVTWKQYYILDKIFDYWWYFFIVLYSINKPIFLFVIILFLFRGIGQFLTIFRKNEKYLLFFPNLIEPYFLFYLISTLSPQTKNILTNNTNSVILISILFIPIMIREYVIHIKNPLTFMPAGYKKWKDKTRFNHD